VRRALRAAFGGSVRKDTVSRVWRKVKSDWDAWNARSLAEEPMVRLILDGTVVRVRLDRKATSISLLPGPHLRRLPEGAVRMLSSPRRSDLWSVAGPGIIAVEARAEELQRRGPD
jgi:Transposase, Mutator family